MSVTISSGEGSGGEKGRDEEGGVLLVNEMQSSAGGKTRCRCGERAPRVSSFIYKYPIPFILFIYVSHHSIKSIFFIVQDWREVERRFV
ncbi:hypothetical protein QVD17_05462 [Tagetes erecta]|uniref:Uncharacterized protein n=1 Tax=Tagetes erecta TaxID=13708 RepID=A0AAD8LDV9_TARER|nr:hypothetical protein QVD17_05462 [Tagetes erecta]